MAGAVRTIRPRQGTSVALMATDGGNNTVAFNPFELRIIRVVDPAGHQLMLDVLSPATEISEVGRRHLEHGQARYCARPPDGRSRVGELRHLSPIVSGLRAEARQHHFSDDLLATLLNEPLVGHGVFWSSVPGTDRPGRPA